jgi:hypothetical protein
VCIAIFIDIELEESGLEADTRCASVAPRRRNSKLARASVNIGSNNWSY